MRIIAGRFRGHRLATPPGSATRPTSDRVRESLFSMLASRDALADARVLDLFAGSGALGLEAVSRGASHATFVERSRKACECIRDNVARLGVQSDTTVYCRDVHEFLGTVGSAEYDLVFADPPYTHDSATLPGLVEDVIAEGGILVLEHDGTRSFQEAPWHITTRRFGNTHISIFGGR